MYAGSIETSRIIKAFIENVPGSYVRDYRDNGGFISVFRGLKDIKWADQIDAGKVEKQVPAETLVSLPRGFTASATKFRGLALERPGWRMQFRRAMPKLTDYQMKKITEALNVGEVFPGIN